jgi:hypothetical protein
LIDRHAKRDDQPKADDGRDGTRNAALQLCTQFQEPDLAIGPHEKFAVNKPSSYPVFPPGHSGL